MAVSSDDLATEVACGMYAARHAVNAKHLIVLWTNLGIFVADYLRMGKVIFHSAQPVF
jgi:hypothetical protein